MVTISSVSQKTVQIRFTLNGEQTDVSFAPYKTLLEVLREELNHTGTKHGCELGECGACAVLLDGKPVLSCLLLALECNGREVVTVEGLGTNGALHPLQEAFADLGAAQCGYCTPAILVTATKSAKLSPEISAAARAICKSLKRSKPLSSKLPAKASQPNPRAQNQERLCQNKRTLRMKNPMAMTVPYA
jgi:aerobic-type carbon monoxide dehydrogenase small subunit (CoxS/CutS family)